ADLPPVAGRVKQGIDIPIARTHINGTGMESNSGVKGVVLIWVDRVVSAVMSNRLCPFTREIELVCNVDVQVRSQHKETVEASERRSKSAVTAAGHVQRRETDRPALQLPDSKAKRYARELVHRHRTSRKSAESRVETKPRSLSDRLVVIDKNRLSE